MDCDVLQADGGTRTASVTGGCVALYDAIQFLLLKERLKHNPFLGFIAAISVGVVDQNVLLDLDYSEDSTAETDMNVVMNDQGGFIEVQGTAENRAFTGEQFNTMLELAKTGIHQLLKKQKACLLNHPASLP